MMRLLGVVAVGLVLFTGITWSANPDPPDRPPPDPTAAENSPASASFSSSPPRSSYVLKSSVIATAGSPATSGDWRLDGTLGQPAPIGKSFLGDADHEAGFWYGYLRLLGTTEVTPTHLGADRLLGVRPNPFNPATDIRFRLDARKAVALGIHDVQGRRVRVLLHEDLAPGEHSVRWNGRDDRGRALPSGVYFVRFVTRETRTVSKVLLLK